MKSLKILVLVHPSCVPPRDATIKEADWANWKTEFYIVRCLKKLGHEVIVYGVENDLEHLQHKIKNENPDIVFNLLEEYQGEPRFESHVVAFLELMGIPYSGCNPQGLSLGRDKALSKKILQYHGVSTPGFFTVGLDKVVPTQMKLNFPLIVKSLNEEASMGISQDSVVYDTEKLKKRVSFIHQQLGTSALVEEYIEGRELYVGVIGHHKLKVLPPWELYFGDMKNKRLKPIATEKVKFDQEYCRRHGIKRGVALGLSPLVSKRLDKLSREIYRALNLSGYARLDFRLTAEDRGAARPCVVAQARRGFPARPPMSAPPSR